MNFIRKLFWGFVDLLLPPRCAGCGQAGDLWCKDCSNAIVPIGEPICICCGDRIFRTRGLCKDCEAHPPAYSALRSMGEFQGPLRKALHRLKYRNDSLLGAALAPGLAIFVSSLDHEAEAVVPVPLARRRLRQRGYNQIELVARPLAENMNLPYQPQSVARTRETRSQVSLGRQDRWANVQGAFLADEASVAGKRILLVDDVATTGSTVDACAAALRQAGAISVFAVTLARAVHYDAKKRISAQRSENDF